MPRLPQNEYLKKPHRKNTELENREDLAPIYQSQDFEPPEDLTSAELKVWEWLVKIFRGTVNCRVSDADRDLMQLYCRAKVATDEADKKYKADPRPYILVALSVDKKTKEPKTTAKPNPYLKIRNDNATLCVKLFDQLGLSPIARTRMGMKAANAENDSEIYNDFMMRTDE